MVEDKKQGAEAQFEFDRMTVERFRQTFPRHDGTISRRHGGCLAARPNTAFHDGVR
jgi:hypothetical protein